MDIYYNNVVEVTKSNFEKKKENDRKRTQERYNNMKKVIENVYNEIINTNYKELVNEAANMGITKVTIKKYESEPNEEFGLQFLWNGPTYNKFNTGVGLKYFQNVNIIPLQNLLQQYFSPFRIVMYCNKEDTHCFDIIW
jgi:hypothetical protein